MPNLYLTDGKIVRRQIIPPKGYAIWSADFAQIQARNIAMESKDPAFCKMLWERYDVHGEWARKLAYAWPDLVGGKRNIKDTAIMKGFRNKIKSGWTFALFFGSHLDNIINNHLHAPRVVLQPLYDEWWETFEGVHRWQQRLIKTYKERGYVENLTGIRRRAPISPNQIINCVDSQTECLAEGGWKTVDELVVGERIYTRNINTGLLELKPLLKLHRSKYIGKMKSLQGSISALATPNHNWLVSARVEYSRRKYRWETKLIPSSRLITHKGSQQKIYLSALPGDAAVSSWTDDEVELIGWFLTDGYIVRQYTHGKGKKSEWGDSAIGVCQSKQSNILLIDALFERLGHKYSRYHYESTGNYTQWVLRNSLGKRLRVQFPNRILTCSFLQQLSQAQLRILYDTMLLGDGTHDKYHTRFISGTKEQADGFSALCVLLGIPCNIKFRPPFKTPAKYLGYEIQNKGVWIVNIKKLYVAQPGWGASWVDFDGEVWCPSTENGTFIARREGTIYVTGNSPIQADEATVVFDAFNRLSEQEDWNLQPIMEIHDDLQFFFPVGKEEYYAEKVVDELLMINFDWINVPIGIELARSDTNWYDMKPCGEYWSDQWHGDPKRPSYAM